MNKNKAYINNLLRQYRDGSISDSDRHQLERIALDDPFLFDSMEGYASAHKIDSKKAIDRIKSQTSAPGAKLISMRIISIAAGIAILIGGLFWVNGQFNAPSQETMSAVIEQELEPNKEDVQPDEAGPIMDKEIEADLVGIKIGNLSGNANPAILLDEPSTGNASKLESPESRESVDLMIPSNNDQSKVETESHVVNNEASIKQKADVQHQTVTAKAKATQNAPESIQAPPSKPAITNVAVEKEPAQMSNNTRAVNTSSDNNGRTKAQTKAKKKLESMPRMTDSFGDETIVVTSIPSIPIPSRRIINGFIRDNTGEPLIGATVLVPNSKNGISTDIDGAFSLEIDSTINKLQIAYTGFSDLIVDLDTSSRYDLMLDEGEGLLDEVVVVGYAANVNAPQPSYVLPPNGRSAYKDVIRNKARTGCTIPGKVKLKFTVTKYGEVTDFEVKKGLSEECNQRAIQIIKDSGTWNNQFNKDKKVRYTISF